jgi:microcin C transport system permease protein
MNLWAYILKRLLLMMPDAAGRGAAHLRRDPVRAGRAGGADLAEAQGGRGRRRRGQRRRRLPRRQGVDPKRIEEIKALYGFDKPPHERFCADAGAVRRFDLGRASSRTRMCGS